MQSRILYPLSRDRYIGACISKRYSYAAHLHRITGNLPVKNLFPMTFV